MLWELSVSNSVVTALSMGQLNLPHRLVAIAFTNSCKSTTTSSFHLWPDQYLFHREILIQFLSISNQLSHIWFLSKSAGINTPNPHLKHGCLLWNHERLCFQKVLTSKQTMYTCSLTPLWSLYWIPDRFYSRILTRERKQITINVAVAAFPQFNGSFGVLKGYCP